MSRLISTIREIKFMKRPLKYSASATIIACDSNRVLLETKAELLKKYIQPENLISLLNKIDYLSFTTFKNFKLELMETFSIQTSLFRNERKSIYTDTRAVLTIARDNYTVKPVLNGHPWGMAN